LLRKTEPFFPPGASGERSRKAVTFVTERLNGEDGSGDFPAMANAVMMFDCLGYRPDHPDCAIDGPRSTSS